jgi:hypothetical protein
MPSVNDYSGVGLVLLRFEFSKHIEDMPKAKEDLERQFTELAQKLVSEYESSGCVDWGIDITLIQKQNNHA